MDSHQHRPVMKLDGKNYFLWASYFRNFLEGKELWGHCSSSLPCPATTLTNQAEVNKWVVGDAKVKTWIMESVDNSIAVNLSPMNTARAMWSYLQRLYQRSSAARMYQLEQSVSTLSQDSRSIQEFYSEVMMIWNEMDLITTDIPEAALATVTTLREQSRCRSFLMKLRPEFEHIRASILNRETSYSLDSILADLLAEETRLSSLASLIPSHGAFKSKYHDVSKVECFNCHEKGHFASQCRQQPNPSAKPFCRYCKQEGHLIENCKIRPPRPGRSTTPSALASSAQPAPSDPSPSSNIDLVQQLIQGLQSAGFGKTHHDSSWFVDSGATHHMTGNLQAFDSSQPYTSTGTITVANGMNLPIQRSGTLSFLFLTYLP